MREREGEREGKREGEQKGREIGRKGGSKSGAWKEKAAREDRLAALAGWQELLERH